LTGLSAAIPVLALLRDDWREDQMSRRDTVLAPLALGVV
jgi:hypothetical protein